MAALFYAPGQWNFYCDLCGKKAKSGDARKTWDGHYVCSHHKEVRNPQDLVRGLKMISLFLGHARTMGHNGGNLES